MKAWALALVLLVAPCALAEGDAPPLFATVDAVAVRFYSPDTGGAAHPRFITQRLLSFEARLLALEEDPQGVIQPRHVRTAVESNIVDEMLVALPLDTLPTPAELAQAIETLRGALDQRVGGRAAVEKAMKTESIDERELEAMLTRQARAAFYLDHLFGPVLTVTDDQLRETYRMTSHPFRSRRFDDARADLLRWLVLERVRSAEQTYLQTARARVTIVYL